MYPTNEQLEERWWHRLVKVLIILAAVASFISAIGIFLNEFWGSSQFLLSFEGGYNEIKAKEQKLEDYPPSSTVIDRIKDKNPPVLSKNSFSVGIIPWGEKERESRRLYPKEFIETQCKGESLLLYSPDCFEKIVENYPEWKIKSWKDYSVFFSFFNCADNIFWTLVYL
jgi:hypothetical protein